MTRRDLLLYNADNEKVFVLICVFCGELIIKKKK